MGNANMSGNTPNAKSKVAGICSTGKWDGLQKSDSIKDTLKKQGAYVEVDEFCAPLLGFNTSPTALSDSAIIAAAAGGSSGSLSLSARVTLAA